MVSFLLACSVSAADIADIAAIRVAVVIPVQERIDNSFWAIYVDILKVAAQQLNIKLDITYSEKNNRDAYFKAIKNVVHQSNKPDYLITVFFNNTKHNLLHLIKEQKVFYISTTGGIPLRLNPKAAKPREKNDYWLGHLLPNDYLAGQALAENLIQQATNRGHKKVNIIAINGAREMNITYERLQGLLAATEHNNVEITQHVYSDWEKNTAKKLTEELLTRHPETNVIWAANDELAWGASIAVEEKGLSSDIVIGGMDLSQVGVELFKKQKITTSIGGHFIEGALALTLLYDYAHKIDFHHNLGARLELEMSLLNNDNITILNDLIINKEWQKLNFKLLSKKEQGHYNHWDKSYSAIIKNIYEH